MSGCQGQMYGKSCQTGGSLEKRAENRFGSGTGIALKSKLCMWFVPSLLPACVGGRLCAESFQLHMLAWYRKGDFWPMQALLGAQLGPCAALKNGANCYKKCRATNEKGSLMLIPPLT